MNLRRYILILSLLLSLLGNAVRAQYAAEVCAGDTGVAFMVNGWENSTFTWTVEGGVITRNFGDSIIVDWEVVPGEYEVTVREVSEFGCAGPLQRGLVHVAGPEVDLGDDAVICEGASYTITPNGNFDSYLWHDGSRGSSYTTGIEGWIRLEVSDEFGCSARDSLYLSVSALPSVNLGPDTALCGEASLDLDAGTDGDIYRWSTGDNSQIITVYAGIQMIWAEVENEFGCVGRDEINIEACDIEEYFKGIPNAITPNGDDTNETWNIYKLAAYTKAVVEIYDRWGTLVWRSEPGYPEPWNGRNMKGDLVPMDSYHFVIQFNNPEKDQLVGIVTVIR